MVLQMARPVRHPKTGIFLFRKRVPDALRDIVGKTEEKVSLGTRDPAEAKILHSQVAAEVEVRWRQFAKGVQTLTHRQAEAIAGEIYRAMMAEHEDNPDQLRRSLLLFDRIMLGKPGAKIYYLGIDPAKSKDNRRRAGRGGGSTRQALETLRALWPRHGSLSCPRQRNYVAETGDN